MRIAPAVVFLLLFWSASAYAVPTTPPCHRSYSPIPISVATPRREVMPGADGFRRKGRPSYVEAWRNVAANAVVGYVFRPPTSSTSRPIPASR